MVINVNKDNLCDWLKNLRFNDHKTKYGSYQEWYWKPEFESYDDHEKRIRYYYIFTNTNTGDKYIDYVIDPTDYDQFLYALNFLKYGENISDR